MKALDFIKESYYEFKDHVTWPTWSQLQQDTVIVAVSTLILSVFLYAVDSFFGNIVIENLFKLLK